MLKNALIYIVLAIVYTLSIAFVIVFCFNTHEAVAICISPVGYTALDSDATSLIQLKLNKGYWSQFSFSLCGNEKNNKSN